MKQFFSVLLFVFLFSAQSVLAAPGDIEGWAWGAGVEPNPAGYGGIGWISMNSVNCDVDKNTFPDVICGGNNTSGTLQSYAVNIPTTNGNLSGYAWSEHYGWISFNASDVVGCPGGTCTAQRVGDNITGWARILSIRDAGVNAGGWQGWISLSDANFGGNNYGLDISKMTKRAWDNNDPLKKTYAYSDELGWIDFGLAGYSADYRICPTSLTIARGMMGQLRAYYNANGLVDCLNLAGTTDVTSLVTWGSSALGVATVGTSTGSVMGVAVGSSNITTNNYNGKTAPSVSVNVTCPALTCTDLVAQTNAYCPTESRDLNNACSGTVACIGTRDCDFNWKETAP